MQLFRWLAFGIECNDARSLLQRAEDTDREALLNAHISRVATFLLLQRDGHTDRRTLLGHDVHRRGGVIFVPNPQHVALAEQLADRAVAIIILIAARHRQLYGTVFIVVGKLEYLPPHGVEDILYSCVVFHFHHKALLRVLTEADHEKRDNVQAGADPQHIALAEHVADRRVETNAAKLPRHKQRCGTVCIVVNSELLPHGFEDIPYGLVLFHVHHLALLGLLTEADREERDAGPLAWGHPSLRSARPFRGLVQVS